MGDLEELYARRRRHMSKRRADLLFIWNVFQFIQPFALRNRKSYPHQHNQLAMLHNYFIIAWRVMSRQKLYAGIKVGGFALGIATCLIISLYIQHELRHDKWIADKERVYRVYSEDTKEGDEGLWTAFPAPVASIIRDEFPEVENAGRLIPFNGWYNAGSNLFRRDDQTTNTYEEGFAYADQELLDILQIPMVSGNVHQALSKPRSLVISERMAQKYFPKVDPVGRLVILNDEDSLPYTIGGVMKDIKDESHLNFNFFITLKGVEFWEGEQTNWCCWNYSVYIKVQRGTDAKALEEKMLSLRDNHYIKYLRETENQYLAETQQYYFVRLQPVGDVYLKSEGIHGGVKEGDITYVKLMGGIAIFILLIACINFINLTTARSANRAKEVGLRKVVGSVRGYLIRQFLAESLLYSVISFAMGLVIAWLAMPYFSMLAGSELVIPWTDPRFIFIVLAASLVVGILAGLYPSIYLSSFRPIAVLKGNIARGSKSRRLRGALVVFQFTTSIFLVIGTMVVHRQMNYILNTKIGYDKEQVIMLEGTNTLDKQQAFKEELKQVANVEHVAISSYMPIVGTKRDQNPFWRDGKSKEEQSVGAQKWYVDEDYMATLGMHLLEGRTFDPDIKSDTSAIIINETMAKEFGFEKPIGELIQNWRTYHIIGVVEDFNFETMKGKIRPLSFVYGDWGTIISAKVKTQDMQKTLADIESVWERFMPNQPIRYRFLDDSYAHMYEDVNRMGKIFTCFAVLALIVACLGLFALSAFVVEQRGKEMSIRLVMGASVKNIFTLVTQNFVMLVAMAIVLAVPLSWYAMQRWLQDYEYRIALTWDIFLIAGLAAIFIALLTVSYQSIKVAVANPVDRLRSE